MFNPIFAGLAMFVFVALKAWQQRNVAFDAPPWIVILTSYGMAFTEVYVISVIVAVGYDLATVFAIGTGAGLGAVAAMVAHRKVFGKQGDKT